MRARPRAVAFDVVQTLMSLEPLRPRLSEVGLAGELLELWFDRILRDGMALTLAGDYVPFPVLAGSALQTLTGGGVDEAAVRYVLAGFAELPAQPDAEPAMRMLADAGISLACLSNGTAKSTVDFLTRSGLSGYMGQVISVEDIQRWKPAGEVYAHALRLMGQPAEEVALVAVHAWDCHGARRAGLTTGWSSRMERHFPEVYDRPDVLGSDLVEVARGLLALPSA